MTDTTQSNAPTAAVGYIRINNVRLAFPELFKPVGQGTQEPRYSCALILPPDHPQLKDIRAKMVAVAKATWGDKAQAQFVALEKGDKLALHDGDTKSQYDGYAGNLFINAAAKKNARPTVIDKFAGSDGQPRVLTEEDGKPYSGCYVNAIVEFWGQKAGTGKSNEPIPARINASLKGVQFERDGDAFGGARPAAASEFEVVQGSDAAEFA